MKNHIQKTSLVLLFLVINSSHSRLPGVNYAKACTFHEDVFAVVPLEYACPVHPDFELRETQDSIHPKFEPHNPECFGSHPIPLQ